MRSLTIVVPTHERCRVVSRLVRDLGRQLAADADLADGVDVVVVVDGSTDGTVEALEALDFPVPLKVTWQRNRGRSAARNVGLSLARGELVLFLDDDLVPLPGLVACHRASHEDADEHVLVGPYPLVPRPFPVAPNNEWFDQVYAELAEARVIDRADRFSIGNTSGPVTTFRSVGGFEEGFTGWGCEDIELGHRLLCMGVDVRFDSAAAAEHRQELSVEQLCANSVSNGRNVVRAITLHPELVDELLPLQPTVRSRRTAKAFAPSGVPCRAGSLSAAIPHPCSRGCPGRPRRRAHDGKPSATLYVAMAASTLAGLAEADSSGELLARKLGISATG